MLSASRCLILVLILQLCFGNTFAKEVDGYIISHDGNKIQGKIRLTSVHYPTGAISINNINYTPLYVSVFFKGNGAKRFKEYYAKDIDGFSFYYNNQQIFFFSIDLPIREWRKIRMRRQFLRLVVNGHYILFDHKKLLLYGNQYNEVTDYYISDTKNQIFNLYDNNYTTLKEFFIKDLKIEEEFLDNQPYKINLRNIKTIILNYNKWKSLH